MKIFDHLLDRGGRVELQQLGRPPADFASPRDVFEQAHQHEQQVTASINKVYGLAVDERDFASRSSSTGSCRSRWRRRRPAASWPSSSAWWARIARACSMLDRELGQRRSGAAEAPAAAT